MEVDLPEAISAALPNSIARAQAMRDGGQRIVGIIGPGVPEALVLAFGAVPLPIIAGNRDTPLANAFVPGEAAQLKALAEPVLDGTLAFLDLLIVTRSHEWLYYTLKEAVRIGEGVVPPLHLHDFVPNRSEGTTRYNRRQFEQLEDALARSTGSVPDSAALQEAIGAIDRRNTCLGTLQQLRDAGKVPGSTALAIIAASKVMAPDDFIATVDPWLIASAATHPTAQPRLLLLPSEATDLLAVHRLAEAAGATVVAEDSDWGSRSAVPTFEDGGLLDALIAAAMAASNGPEVQPRSARTRWAESQIGRSDIGGVIFAMPRSDRRFGWDYPALRDRVAAAGKPALLLRDDPKTDAAAASMTLGAFVAQLSGQGKAA